MSRLRTLFSGSVVSYGLASIIVRGLSVATMVVLTPWALMELGSIQYGIWVLAIQIPLLVVTPDLGLTYGLVNEVSDARRRGTPHDLLVTKLQALGQLLRITAVGWLVLGILAIVGYAEIAHGPSSGTFWQLAIALSLSLICFCVGIPSSLWPKVQLAEESGHHALIWEAVGRFASLTACMAVLLWAPSLNALVVAFALPPSVAWYANSLAARRRRGIARFTLKTMPAAQAFSISRSTFGVGRYFLVMQLSFLFATAIDPFLVATFINASAAAEWSVTRRPFDLLPLIVGLFSTALWPVFNRLNANAQYARSARILVILLVATLTSTLGLGVGLIGIRAPLYDYLSGGAWQPSIATMCWLTTAAATTSALLVISNYLNAIDRVRVQARLLAAGTVGLILGKIIALSFGDLESYFIASGLGIAALHGLPLAIVALREIRARTSTQPKRSSVVDSGIVP